MAIPKTRIMVVEKNNGTKIYFAQERNYIFKKYWLLYILFIIGFCVLITYWYEGEWREDGGLFWNNLYGSIPDKDAPHGKVYFREHETQLKAQETIDEYLRKYSSKMKEKKDDEENRIANKVKSRIFIKYP